MNGINHINGTHLPFNNNNNNNGKILFYNIF